MAHSHSAHGSTAHDHDHAHGSGHGDHAGFAHPTPVWQLAAVFVALLVLTVLTVSTGSMGLGEWEIVASLGIAFLKATLVALFFMHLIHDKPFNQMLFTFSLAFIALFIGFTMMDTQTYNPLVEARDEDVPFQPPPVESSVEATPAEGAAGEAAPHAETAPPATGGSKSDGSH